MKTNENNRKSLSSSSSFYHQEINDRIKMKDVLNSRGLLRTHRIAPELYSYNVTIF